VLCQQNNVDPFQIFFDEVDPLCLSEKYSAINDNTIIIQISFPFLAYFLYFEKTKVGL
jgi:hypothetical protein